jgi:hypothetical protein
MNSLETEKRSVIATVISMQFVRSVPFEKILRNLHSYRNSGKRRLILRPYRQKIDSRDVNMVNSIIPNWEPTCFSNFGSDRNKDTLLLLDSLRAVHAMSASDVCFMKTCFDQSRLAKADSGIDPVLVETFSELLEKVIKLNCDCLCLTDLFSTYLDLLKVSVADRNFVPLREQFANALLCRIKSSEELPQKFPIVQFLGSFVCEIDSQILDGLSQWAHKSIDRESRDTSTCPLDLVDAVLAIDEAYNTRKIPVPDRFISAVRKLVS